MTDIEKPVLPDPVAQDQKLVGDEAVQAERHEVEPVVNTDPVAAQVAQPREADTDKVNVHETTIVTDRIITDPSSPLAVQVPDAGRGSLDLPAHRLAAPTVEEVFSAKASTVTEVSDEERAQAQSTGTVPASARGSETPSGDSGDQS